MKRILVVLLSLLIVAVVVVAGGPTPLPVKPDDDLFGSPLPVGAMQFFPNYDPEDAANLLHNGSFEDEDHYADWSFFPEYTQIWGVGAAAARHGEYIMIQGLTDEHEHPEQAMQCWWPGDLSGYMNFALWASYRVDTNEPPWLHVAESRALLIEWDTASETWGRITTDLWVISGWDDSANWTDIQTRLVGLGNHDDRLVCLLIESTHGSYLTEFQYDFFFLVGFEVVGRAYLPLVAR